MAWRSLPVVGLGYVLLTAVSACEQSEQCCGAETEAGARAALAVTIPTTNQLSEVSAVSVHAIKESYSRVTLQLLRLLARFCRSGRRSVHHRGPPPPGFNASRLPWLSTSKSR